MDLFGMFGGLSFRGRIIAFIAGALILIILLLGLKAILGGNNGLNMPSMYAVLGEQRELMNLSTAGNQQASASITYLNFSATALAAVTTDHLQLLKLLASNGIKVSPKDYVMQPQADTQLTQAAQISNFDPVYATVMQEQLTLYQSDLSSAINLSTSQVLKTYLTNYLKNAALLQKMLGSSYG